MLRERPYLLMFPLALLCGWLGVSHWMLYGLGVISAYSGLGHALVLTQAMFGAFALGFLMTAIPRRTSTAPAHPVELFAAAAAVVVTAAAAHAQRFAIAEYGAVGILSVLLVFAVRRTGSAAGRRPPNAFVMIPIGCAAGIAGAVLVARMANGQGSLDAYLIGRQLVQQGVFLCFLLGVGALILPLIQGAPPPADATSSRANQLARLGYAALGALVVATLVADPWWPRLASAVRAVAVAVGLVANGALRWPALPGFHRRVAVVAVWLTPLGLALAALVPDHAIAMQHVMFIGGLSLLAFAVSAHVALGHADRADLLASTSVRSIAMAAIIGAAIAVRAAAHHWPESYYTLLAVAAALWIAGSLAWAALAINTPNS